LLFRITGISQTVFWIEDFESPPNWTIDNNWVVNPGFLRFHASPEVTNFDLSVISEEITLPFNVHELIVNQYIDVYEFLATIEKANISILIDTSEVILWSYELSSGNWGSSTGTDMALSINQYAGSTVRVKMNTTGATTYGWDYWDIFEVSITANLMKDLSVDGIDGPNNILINQTDTFSVSVSNNGQEAQSDFEVELYCMKTGDLLGNFLVSDSIQPGETRSYIINWTPTTAYNTSLIGKVVLNGDEYAINNVYKSHFLRISPAISYSILIWDNDNNTAQIVDPELGDLIEPDEGLTRAFDAAGITYDFCTALPADISGWDMVFTTLGCYCLS